MSDNSTQNGFRKCIGLRYVPLLAGTWDITKDYEQLSIVIYEGNSYTSKKPVPSGITLDNEEFWVMTGNYNVQIANLTNEVEVAVRTILDYATDFEIFKETMNKLFDDFVVDANGQVLAKVEEYENLIGEQYEAFVRYVNNALQQYRDEWDTFSEETNQKIQDFIDSSNKRIDTKFEEYRTEFNNELSGYSSQTNNRINNISTQLDNLILEAGNPESSSAEIVAARGSYSTLAKRFDGLGTIYLATKTYTPYNNTYDLNNMTSMGIYKLYGGTGGHDMLIDNTPYGDSFVSQGGFLIAYTFGPSGGQPTAYCKQILSLKYGDYYHTFERYYIDGVFTNWNEEMSTENTMHYVYLAGIANFNSDLGMNNCFIVDGYEVGHKPENSPNILPEEDYVLQIFGKENNCTQLVYTGTNNRVFIRRKINGTWTDWDNLTTSDDVESACASVSSNILGRTIEYINYSSQIANFNSQPAINQVWLSSGYNEDSKPLNSPDFPANTPYLIETFGNLSLRNQLFLNDSDDKFYVRRRINNSWGEWDYVLTGKNLGNAHILNNLEVISTLSDFNELETDFDCNIGIIGGGILPNISNNVQCYIYNAKNGENIKQIVVNCETGKSYVRQCHGGAWNSFSEAYDTSAFKSYNAWSSQGISVATLNSQTLANPDYFTNKIFSIKFNEDITGDANPVDSDTMGYLITNTYGTAPNNFIHQTFITSNGRIFQRSYTGVSDTWGSFNTPYYTKSQIDEMLQNI